VRTKCKKSHDSIHIVDEECIQRDLDDYIPFIASCVEKILTSNISNKAKIIDRRKRLQI
jgi:hypothetical protein